MVAIAAIVMLFTVFTIIDICLVMINDDKER